MSVAVLTRGTAVSWGNFPSTPAAAAGELLAAVTGRRVNDFTRIERVRLYESGVANAPNGAVIELQGSLDGSAWSALGTYDDGGPGPSVFCSKHNGNATWVGEWCTIAPQFRTRCFTRIVGRGGSDATSSSWLDIGYDLDPRVAVYPSNTTGGTTKTGRQTVFFGGSQIKGGGNPGEFASGDAGIAAAKAAVDPQLLLGHAGGGATLIRDGVTLTAIPTEHGPELGLLRTAQLAGKLAGTRVLGRYSVATPTPDWVTTHFATLQADITSAGMDPTCLCYITGGQDSINIAAIANLQESLRKLSWLIEVAYPGALFIVMGVVAADVVSFPFLAENRVVANRYMRDNIHGNRWHIPHNQAAVQLQATDNTHPTDLGEFTMGQQYAIPYLQMAA